MKQVSWLDRDLISGPHLVLVTSREQFNHVMRKLGIKDSVAWIGESATATTTHLRSDSGKSCCVVSIKPEVFAEMDPIDQASVLVHEGVHVFQNHCEDIGERNPSSEFEAYSIQRISQQLMLAYRKTLK